MISRFLLVTLLMLAGLGSGGCALFHRKAKEPKPAKEPKISGTPVADMEKSFKDKWIAHRVTELLAAGVSADQAQVQATREYGEAYKYTRPGR